MAERSVRHAIVVFAIAVLVTACATPELSRTYSDAEVQGQPGYAASLREEQRVRPDQAGACADLQTQRMPPQQVTALTGAWREVDGQGDYAPPAVVYRAPLAWYPPAMFAENRPGAVATLLMIERDGSVGDARVICSTHPDFEEPALATVRRNRYRAAVVAGRPVREVAYQVVAYSTPGSR